MGSGRRHGETVRLARGCFGLVGLSWDVRRAKAEQPGALGRVGRPVARGRPAGGGAVRGLSLGDCEGE